MAMLASASLTCSSCLPVQTCEATDDVMLGQYHIPAGTRIWINVRSLHLDDKHFTNAKVRFPNQNWRLVRCLVGFIQPACHSLSTGKHCPLLVQLHQI